MADRTVYFAAQSKEELAHDLSTRIDEWRNVNLQTGISTRWRRSHELYFGEHFPSVGKKAHGIMKTGSKGQLVAFAVNHYRNMIKHTLSMTTNQKPSFDPKAVNTDYDSLQQTRLASNILEYYMEEKQIRKYLKNAGEHAQVYARGYVLVLWDPSLGDPVGTSPVMDDDGEPVMEDDGSPAEKVVYEGDLTVETPLPEDVFVDPNTRDWRKLEWADIRLFRNKFALANQYPHLKEKILQLETLNELEHFRRRDTFQNFNKSATVPVYYFCHPRSRALPNGRLQIRCNADLVLYDGPYPYEDRMCLFRIVPGEIFGTTEGYTDAFDLIGIQEAINTLVSIAFSNQAANGVQKIWVPNTGDISTTQLSEALAVLRGPPGSEPKPLQLTATAKEIFEFMPMLQKMGETTFGVNSVARGDPDHSLDSGVALGLVQAMAVQYASAFQESWADLLRDVATFIVWVLKEFASTERKIAIGGVMNRGYMTSFTSKDLVHIDRVTVDLGNPMSRTLAGRADLADKYLEKGFIQTPQQYESVLTSGRLDALTENLDAQLALIRQEKEYLLKGKPVKAIVGDKHLLHMQDHMALLANPEVRLNAPIAEAVTAHVQEHAQLYQTQAPIFSMISGEPPPPPPPAPPGPPSGGPPQGPPPGPAGPPPGAPPAQGQGAPQPPGPPGHNPGHPPHGGHPGHHPAGPGSNANGPLGPLMTQPLMPHIERLPPQLQPQVTHPQ